MFNTPEADEELKSAYADSLFFVNQMLDNYDAIVLSAVLLSITMSLYRTILPDPDFDQMIDSVAEAKDKIQPFRPQHMGGLQ